LPDLILYPTILELTLAFLQGGLKAPKAKLAGATSYEAPVYQGFPRMQFANRHVLGREKDEGCSKAGGRAEGQAFLWVLKTGDFLVEARCVREMG
jgi:hypothetical protein